MIGVGGILVWLIVAPPLMVAIYFIVRPLLRNFAARLRTPVANRVSVS